MSYLKIGWIGSGFIGQVGHLNLYEDINIAKITCLSELRAKLAKKVSIKNNIKNVYLNYEEMIDKENLDAVVLIVNRNHTAFHAEKILKKKLNLFTEKPQASTYQGAKNLVKIAKKNKLVYATGLMRRHDEGIKYAKKLINKFKKNNTLGNLIGADFFCFAGGDYCNIGNYISTNEPKFNETLCPRYPLWLKKKYGRYYEEFLNVYIHDLDLMSYVLDEKLNIKQLDYNPSKISNLLLNANNIPINFKWRKINANQWYEGFNIYFDKGSVDVKLNPAFLKNISSLVTINKYGKGGLINSQKLENFSFNWSFYNQHIDFLNSVKNKTTPISDCSKTIQSMRIVDEVFHIINQ